MAYVSVAAVGIILLATGGLAYKKNRLIFIKEDMNKKRDITTDFEMSDGGPNVQTRFCLGVDSLHYLSVIVGSS